MSDEMLCNCDIPTDIIPGPCPIHGRSGLCEAARLARTLTADPRDAEIAALKAELNLAQDDAAFAYGRAEGAIKELHRLSCATGFTNLSTPEADIRKMGVAVVAENEKLKAAAVERDVEIARLRDALSAIENGDGQCHGTAHSCDMRCKETAGKALEAMEAKR